MSTIYAFAARAVPLREVSTLQGEIRNDAMQCRAFVAKGFSGHFAGLAGVAGSQFAKIVGRFRGIVTKQTKNNFSYAFAVDLQFKKDAVRNFGQRSDMN